MNFSEYAIAKLNGYKKLGWTTGNVDSTDTYVKYTTVDLSGVTRNHLFSENEIKVEIVANAPVMTEYKEEVPTIAPIEAATTAPDEVAIEAPKKRTRKSKKSEA